MGQRNQKEQNLTRQKEADQLINELKNDWDKKNDYLKSELMAINHDFFSYVYEEIDERTFVEDLYNINSYSYKEQILALRKQIRLLISQVEDLDEQTNIELSSHKQDLLLPSESFNSIENQLKEIDHKLDEIHLNNARENFDRDFVEYFGKLNEMKILKDKFLMQQNKQPLSFEEKKKSLQQVNKTEITKIKTHLDHYKLRWIWYVVLLVLFFIGAILAILIPLLV